MIFVLSFSIVVAYPSHGHFKVSCSLVLELVSQRVDLETIQPTTHKKRSPVNGDLETAQLSVVLWVCISLRRPKKDEKEQSRKKPNSKTEKKKRL